ncbi:MAG: hypothetical protein QOJ40_1714 [Verrucomicrobiota bacterium]
MLNAHIFQVMTFVILSWVGISTLFCLGLLRVAARPFPSIGEEILLAHEGSTGPGVSAGVTGNFSKGPSSAVGFAASRSPA